MKNDELGLANSILTEANLERIDITPMMLQKLMFFFDAWHRKLADGESILGAIFQAWAFGPVAPNVYHEFKEFGASPITRLARDPRTGAVASKKLTKNQKALLKDILDTYGKLSGPQLSHLTHEEDTPWSKAIKNGRNSKISDELMCEYAKILGSESD